MTTINGYNGANHNVEDILASIRTSIADDAGPTRMVAQEARLPARREPPTADAAEFELPAIFKPGHNSLPEKPKLFGRLSDALKTATPQEEEPRSRTVIPFDPSVAGRMLEPPVQSVMSAQRPNAPQTIAPQQASQPRPSPAEREEEPVARVMPTFFDTRINRLGELTRQAYEPPKPDPEPEQVEVEPEPQAALRQPPELPEAGFAQHATEAVDDAAAQLLRPMLRQWLHENMPKIVEKALLSEVQGSQPKGRK
ncbi:MAG: DUF2497 domain-containing protein [Hyphomicrobium sp.]